MGGGRLGQRGPVVGGGVELDVRVAAGRPPMGAARELDGAGGGRGVVEGDPAGGHLPGAVPRQVAVVPVEAERQGSHRLPEQVVLDDPRPRPAGQPRQRLTQVGPQHDRCNQRVGPPAIADLAGQGRVVALLPVDLVGRDAGREHTAEDPVERLVQQVEQPRVEQALDQHEPVGVEVRLLVVGEGERGGAHRRIMPAHRLPDAARTTTRVPA